MTCQKPILCTRPVTPLKDWLVYNHQVLRVIWVPPKESRQVLGGLLAVSILISMLVMFMFWKTNPTCRLQDECSEACKAGPSCPTKNSRFSNMTVIVWKKPATETDEWSDCKASAIKWMSSPQSPTRDLVCFFPNPADQNTLECLEPLQGDACDQEKKYMKMLSGASSIAILLSFMLVPRLIEFIFSTIFGICCSKVFLKTQGKTVKGVSLGLLIVAGLAILVALFILTGGSGFIGLRLGVWFATWIGSMLIFEPLAALISYYLIRCDNRTFVDDHDHAESKPLLENTALAPSMPENEEPVLSIEPPPTAQAPEETPANLDESSNV